MVIDVGGQDSKVILVDDRGMAIRFVMNDKCAAGTGRFLEVMARALEIDSEEMGVISLRSQNRVEVSSVCTVFAETEVITLLASGYDKSDIVAAIFRAIARRLIGFINQIGIKEKIVMTGGVAKGIGLRTVLAEKLKTEILIPEEPQINGAFGAAAIALDKILQRR
jgi:predicted CoA-substrate-specific enzyme activase